MGEAEHPAALSPPIGLIIRDRRRELGLSQKALAERLGMDQSVISRLERGLEGMHHVPRVLQALEIDVGAGGLGDRGP